METISFIVGKIFWILYAIFGTIFVIVVCSALFGAVGYMIYYILRYGLESFAEEFINK